MCLKWEKNCIWFSLTFSKEFQSQAGNTIFNIKNKQNLTNDLKFYKVDHKIQKHTGKYLLKVDNTDTTTNHTDIVGVLLYC